MVFYHASYDTEHRYRERSNVRTRYLAFNRPWISEEEIDEVVDTLRSGWLTTGPKTAIFERDLAEYLNIEETSVLAVNSGTAGLSLALMALGIGNGDEVITTNFTFSATVNIIEQASARPVLVDVDEDTLNLNPDNVEKAVTSNTRAILPVHFGGHPCEMDTLKDIAARYDLAVVEDAAHALGASYKGRIIGSLSDFTVFSLYANKNMTTGEGGFVVANREFVDKARKISLHGIDKTAWSRTQDGAGAWHYDVVFPGLKYNMTDIAASIGLHQLRKFPAFQARRRKIADRYVKSWKDHELLDTPIAKDYVEHAWHLFPLRLRLNSLKINRQQFINELHKRKIGASVHNIPIHLLRYYREKYRYREWDFPVSMREYSRLISMPLYPCMKDEDVEYVIGSVLEIVDTYTG